MKTFLSSLLIVALFAALAFGEDEKRSVHLRPSLDSPVIGHVAKDSALLPPAEAPALSEREIRQGWQAISFADDFRGFLPRSDLTKTLDVAPGSAIYLSKSRDSSRILTRANANDAIEVERLAGEWVEVSFSKPVTAFVRKEPNTPVSEPTIEALEIKDGELADADPSTSGLAVVSARAGIPSDGVLRSFQGYLGQPRSFLGRHPPYPFQMVDASNNRIAYLDLSRLLITTPMEHFIGHQYEFYGHAEPIEGRRDFVIRVERMFRK